MATCNTSRFSKPDGFKSVAPDVLLALFESHRDFFENRGTTLPRQSDTKDLDYDALIKVLMEPAEDTPRDLVDALWIIDEIATSDGMDSLLAEIQRRNIPLRLRPDPTPTEVAIGLWLTKPDLLARKHAEAYLSRPRSFESYQRDIRTAPASPRLGKKKLSALEAELNDWFAAKKRGRGARVLPFPRGNDTWFLIRHGEPYKREGAVEQDKSSSVFYRPEKHDVLVYYAAIGELRINAASKGEKDLYRRSFGLHLFGDENHFPGAEKYTLEPLRTDGPASLTCSDVDGIESVILKEVWIYRGDLTKRWRFEGRATYSQRSNPVSARSRRGVASHGPNFL